MSEGWFKYCPVIIENFWTGKIFWASKITKKMAGSFSDSPPSPMATNITGCVFNTSVVFVTPNSGAEQPIVQFHDDTTFGHALDKFSKNFTTVESMLQLVERRPSPSFNFSNFIVSLWARPDAVEAMLQGGYEIGDAIDILFGYIRGQDDSDTALFNVVLAHAASFTESNKTSFYGTFVFISSNGQYNKLSLCVNLHRTGVLLIPDETWVSAATNAIAGKDHSIVSLLLENDAVRTSENAKNLLFRVAKSTSTNMLSAVSNTFNSNEHFAYLLTQLSANNNREMLNFCLLTHDASSRISQEQYDGICWTAVCHDASLCVELLLSLNGFSKHSIGNLFVHAISNQRKKCTQMFYSTRITLSTAHVVDGLHASAKCNDIDTFRQLLHRVAFNDNGYCLLREAASNNSDKVVTYLLCSRRFTHSELDSLINTLSMSDNVHRDVMSLLRTRANELRPKLSRY